MKRLLFVEDKNFDKAVEMLKDGGIIPTPAKPDIIPECAEKILFDVGVPLNVKGFKFLVAAIDISARFGANHSVAVTKDIYPAVAGMFGTDSWTVERDMRFALDSTWKKGLNIAYFKHFQRPYTRPSNSEFLSVMTKIVLEKLEKESFGD